ncbi:isochorismatase family protein [Chloroflexota bacterium]
MAIWDDVISQSEKEIYIKSGHLGGRIGLGNNPALLVIDVTYNFVGDKPEPVLKSIERFPLSCGEAGWEVVRQFASLLPLARAKKVPIIYSAGGANLPRNLTRKNPRMKEMKKIGFRHDIVREIAPTEDDIVIHKYAYSVFHGTALLNVLLALGVDTLLCGGLVASGCVRATVIDACQYGFPCAVIEECAGDRAETPRKVSLFDLNAKYASVIPIAEARDYLNKLDSKS